jgi:CDP-paratose 2-epimerase
MKSHYPNWDVTKSLDETVREIIDAWRHRAPLSSF